MNYECIDCGEIIPEQEVIFTTEKNTAVESVSIDLNVCKTKQKEK